MRRISAEQADQILAVSAEGLSYYPPAALEKDVHLTAILQMLKTLPAGNCRITFGGGTSLVKGFQLFDRMSEDLDFKTSFVNRMSGQGESKKMLSALKNNIFKIMQDSDFGIEITAEENGNKHFAFEIQYEPAFQPIVSLRAHIQLEFTFSELTQPASDNEIHTLLNFATRKMGQGFTFPCVAPAQTAVEKILGFFSKYQPDSILRSPSFDSRIVRHIHDSFYLQKSLTDKTLAKFLLESAIEEDLNLRGRSSNTDKEIILTKIRAKVGELTLDKSIESSYEVFVSDLTSPRAPKFESALESFVQLTKFCVQS